MAAAANDLTGSGAHAAARGRGPAAWSARLTSAAVSAAAAGKETRRGRPGTKVRIFYIIILVLISDFIGGQAATRQSYLNVSTFSYYCYYYKSSSFPIGVYGSP